MKTLKIFVSYSHRDGKHIQADGIVGFLKGLERDTAVQFWVDDSLIGGDKWDDKIKHEIETSHIALLLISQTYLDSYYCMQIEVQNFMSRMRDQGLIIFPVILSPCEWELHSWLSTYQMLPGGNETIEDYCHENKEKKIYLKIRKELRSVIDQVWERLKQNSNTPQVKTEINAELKTVTLLRCCLSVKGNKYDLDQEDQLEFLYEAAPLFKERCVSEIELLNGYIVKMSSAGDISVCYGYPEAQELDSVKAVRTGFAILKTCRNLNQQLIKEWNAQLTIKIGVHTGLVIGKTGADTQEQLENGQVSSIAEVIMKSAPEDAIAISEQTYGLVKDFFKSGYLKEVPDTGHSKSIKIWTIHSDLGVNTRFEASMVSRSMPIVGRQQEINLISEKWEKVKQKKGQFILLSAEAGLGKSRLIQEIRSDKINNQVRVFDYQCSMFTQNSAFQPVIRSLEKMLGIKEEDKDPEKLIRIQDFANSSNLPQEDIIPYLAVLLQVDCRERSLISELTPKQLKDKTLEAILWLVLSQSDKSPLLIIMEDLHWADSSTLDYLNMLCSEISAVSICLLASARPEFPIPGNWQINNYFSLIKLDQLENKNISEMVKNITGKQLPGELFAAICKKTEGYPLFVEELTRMIIDSDMVKESGNEYVLVKPLEALSIPDTLHESLMARLSKLEGGKVIAQIGAILGREFSFELIKEIAPLDPVTLREVLDRLVGSGLFYRNGFLSRQYYTFKHALIQDTLYNSLLKKERKRHHKKTAAVLKEKYNSNNTAVNPELLMHHFSEADEFEEAVVFGMIACQKAANEYANPEVVNIAKKILHILSNIPPSSKRNLLEKNLLLYQGPAMLALKGWSSHEYGNVFRRAKELCDAEKDIHDLFVINRGLWAHYMVSAQLKDSITISDELLALAEKENSDDLRLEAHAAYCDSYFWMGKPAKSLEHAITGLQIYDLETHHTKHSLIYGEDPSVVMLCYSLLCFWLLGHTDKAEERATLIKESISGYSHKFSIGFLYNSLAWFSILKNDPGEAFRWGNELMTSARENDFFQWLAVAKTQVGWANANREESSDKGIEEIREGISMFTSAGGKVTLGFCRSFIIDTLLREGKSGPSSVLIEEALADYESCEDRFYLSEILRLKAELLSKTSGDFEMISAIYDASLREAESQKAFSLKEKTRISFEKFSAANAKGVLETEQGFSTFH